MARKTGLGKGLDALIPSWQDEVPAQANASAITLIPINLIGPNPRQPRKLFEESSLAELADSIHEHGIIQPLILVQAEDGQTYTLIAGERRWRAARLAGLSEVPALVRDATHQQQLEFAIIENVQREDLNALERAKAYQSLLEEFTLTHDEIAQRVGKSRTTITNTLRLLNLPAKAQNALMDNLISEGHARALLSLPNPKAIEAALDTIQSLDLNVRQTEALVSKLAGKAPRKNVDKAIDPIVHDLENRLRQFLHTKVSLHHGARGGSITIYYYSDEELNQITQRFGLDE